MPKHRRLPAANPLMLRRAAFRFLNHLLSAEGWASARLKPFSGQRARFQLGPFRQTVVVGGDGSLAACDDGGTAAVTVCLPDDAPFRLLRDHGSLFGSARIAGAADFAEALGFVARNLRWDAEADLARILGDIPAHRLAQVARGLVASGSEQRRRLFDAAAEFAAENTAAVLTTSTLHDFRTELRILTDDLTRLEQRIGALP